MSRFLTFAVMGLVLLVMSFAAWKMLHLTPATMNEIPAAALTALEHPTAMTIASIRKEDTGGGQIGGYAVVQAAQVSDQAVREQCALTLLACVSDVGKSPECFSPSMAIKVTNAHGEFVFLPCFKCGHMKVVGKLTGQNEDWTWVEIRATGHEFAPIFQALRLAPPPPS
jgi:hypothetical protein